MKKCFTIIAAITLLLLSCTGKTNETDMNQTVFTGEAGEVKLIVLAPGHFHASLLQKSRMEQVNDSVQVYAAAEDAGLRQYLSADRKSTRLNSSHVRISYAVFCLKKKSAYSSSTIFPLKTHPTV